MQQFVFLRKGLSAACPPRLDKRHEIGFIHFMSCFFLLYLKELQFFLNLTISITIAFHAIGYTEKEKVVNLTKFFNLISSVRCIYVFELNTLVE